MQKEEKPREALEDVEIIELFFARLEQAIAELAYKYGRGCMGVARNILGRNNTRDAEECVNDAYLVVWNKLPPERPNPLRTYVYKIVRNRSCKKLEWNTADKRNTTHDISMSELEDSLGDVLATEQKLEAKELELLISEFLEALEPKDRIMFLSRYWYGDEIPEIAARFQTNRHYVSVRLSRIRKKLRDYLMKEGVDV